MATPPDESVVVLVVEDERNLADLYATWLGERFDVRTAYDADQAIDNMDDAVDVVLLDRRLPGMSGDEFLEYVRAEGFDCQVAMVSAVDPDFEILEMGFDDYVTKPVDRDELIAVVDRLVGLDAAGTDTQEYFAMVAKKDALEAQKSPSELAANAEYAALLREIEAFRRHVVSLAEGYLAKTATDGAVDDTLEIYRAGIQEWTARQRGLAESDPLYRTATAEIERYQEQMAELQEGPPPEAEFLSAVAEGFVAEGFWLDSRVRRALNQILFDKDSDTLVVKGQPLAPDASLSPEEHFDASTTVRELAESALTGTHSR